MFLCKHHHRHALRCLFHLLLALCAVPKPFVGVVEAACSPNGHQFEARVEYQWSKERDAAFPIEVETSPGFKMLTCVTHSANFSLWEISEPCNDGMRSFFNDIVNLASSTEIKPFQNIYELYETNKERIADYSPPKPDEKNNVDGLVFGNTIDPQGFDNVTLSATIDQPFMSCFAMIWPSSDWFIGITKFNVCEMEDNPTSFKLNAFDAGLYRTSEYKEATESDREAPPEPFIRQVRGVGPSGYGWLLITDQNKGIDVNRNSESGVCFPADELITLASGDKMRMDQLSIGNSVMTPLLRHPLSSNLISDGLPNSRSNTSSRVYAFSHKHPKVMTTFLRISYVVKNNNETTMTSASSSRYPSSTSSRHGHVRLSPSHYIYRFQQTSHLSAHSAPDLAPASTVRVGDLLLISPSSGSVSTSLATVVDIRSVVATGLYNPHTLAGHMVVGDVVVSCYTQTVNPNVAVAALAPVRSAHQVGLWTVADMAVSFVSSVMRRRLAAHERLRSWLGVI